MEDKRPILTVAVVNKYITSIFNAEDMLHDVRVEGEVSGFSVRAGNAYFALKDTSGQLACMCFGVARTYVPREGERIIVRGTVKYYNKRGTTYFDIFSIEPKGQGDIYARFLELKSRLAEEGVFDSNRKKPLPYIISNICVLTSINGAVIQDILHTVVGVCPEASITAVDCRVQGDTAAKTLLDNLLKADEMGYDVIIIARGGGSQEDLMPFNDEALVRGIAAAHTPIISAVGHETDYTLCDLACDVRALTPTMAGKLIVDAWNRVRQDVYSLKSALVTGLNGKVQQLQYEIAIERARMLRSMMEKYSRLAQKSELLKTKLDSLDPTKLLKIGYIIAEKNGKRLFSAHDIKNGDVLSMHFDDGMITVKIEKLEN